MAEAGDEHLREDYEPEGRGEDEAGEAEEAPDLWELLPTQKRKLRTADAKKVAECLKKPPPHEKLKALMDSIPLYEGVPATPKSTNSIRDRRYHSLQRKLEMLLHVVVQIADADNREQAAADSSIAVSALARAAFEDVNELRRHEFVGRMAPVVLKRTSEDAQLLDKDEQENWAKRRRSPFHSYAARGRGRAPPPRRPTYSRSPFRGRGGGGRGRSSGGRGRGN